MHTQSLCIEALSKQLAKIRPGAERAVGYPEYTAHLQDNLVTEVDQAALEADYGSGAGQELQWGSKNGVPPKMHAVYSSSALVVNTFGGFKIDPASLRILGHTGFERLRFEAKCPTGLKGIPPHLDVLCTSTREETLAIESKCLEFLQPHPAHFSERYDTLYSLTAALPYFDLIPSLRGNPDQFKYLDAAQLVKHALGLAYCFPSQRATLLYLFWEPVDWREFPEFCAHREEARSFADAVSGAGIEFQYAAYPEIWESWRSSESMSWVQQHADNLTQRYGVTLFKSSSAGHPLGR